MALLSRDSILAAQDIRTKDVLVAEWGGTIRVRSMTLAEQSEFARLSASSDDREKVTAWMVATLAVDEAGASLFKAEDVKELEKKNFRSIQAVVAAILEVNGIGEAQVEAAAKN